MDVLDKFIINFSEPKIAEKISEIKDHSTFKLIPEELRKSAMGVLVQWLIDRAIEDSNRWEINIKDFNNDLRFSLSHFTKDYIPFPTIKNPVINSANGYKFIEKLDAINLKNKDKDQAFQDYVKSEEAYKELLKINPTLEVKLSNYENDIKVDITNEKSAISYSLTLDCFSNGVNIEKSRQVYFNCILKSHNQIPGVKDTEKFFRDGRIHNINEYTDFEWLYKESDL